MHHHRLLRQMSADRTDGSSPPAQGFVMCPLPLQQGWQGPACPWQQVYQLAYAQAQAVIRPSVMERFQANSWN